MAQRIQGQKLQDQVRELYLNCPDADPVTNVVQAFAEGSMGEEFAEYEDVRAACENLALEGELELVGPEIYRAGPNIIADLGYDSFEEYLHG